jgi:hypothetical protein
MLQRGNDILTEKVAAEVAWVAAEKWSFSTAVPVSF